MALDRTAAFAKARALLQLAVNAAASSEEARTAAMQAARLIVEHDLLGDRQFRVRVPAAAPAEAERCMIATPATRAGVRVVHEVATPSARFTRCSRPRRDSWGVAYPTRLTVVGALIVQAGLLWPGSQLCEACWVRVTRTPRPAGPWVEGEGPFMVASAYDGEVHKIRDTQSFFTLEPCLTRRQDSWTLAYALPEDPKEASDHAAGLWPRATLCRRCWP